MNSSPQLSLCGKVYKQALHKQGSALLPSLAKISTKEVTCSESLGMQRFFAKRRAGCGGCILHTLSVTSRWGSGAVTSHTSTTSGLGAFCFSSATLMRCSSLRYLRLSFRPAPSPSVRAEEYIHHPKLASYRTKRAKLYLQKYWKTYMRHWQSPGASPCERAQE